jgi:hypothetical protein
VDAWLPILTLAAGIVTGLFGGIGVERYRAQRKDLDHRRDHYHRYLSAVDAWEFADSTGGDESAAYEAMTYHQQAIEVFGNRKVSQAIEELSVVLGESAVYDARQDLVKAMNRDVGPRRWIFLST